MPLAASKRRSPKASVDTSQRGGVAKSTEEEPPEEPRRRQRLSPEARADQILDVAARLLIEDGFTEVSMERLGREAGISKALVYNYFPSRNDLLCALLRRETERSRVQQLEAVKGAGGDFAAILRSTTRLAVVNQRERGVLLSRLWAEPAVVRALEADERRTREEYIDFFSRKINRIYGIPMEKCRGVVVMGMAMTGAAASHYADSRLDTDAITDLCIDMILGGLEALRVRS